jgi:hypothetical protein
MSGYYDLPDRDDKARGFRWVCRTTLDPVLSSHRSRTIAASLMQYARNTGLEHVFVEEWSAKRAIWVKEVTLRQRDWQTKVSRRPQRGRHHDSWSIRERYVTCKP